MLVFQVKDYKEGRMAHKQKESIVQPFIKVKILKKDEKWTSRTAFG